MDQVTTDQLLHEIGSLHVQTALLRARVKSLEEANATLTAELRNTTNERQTDGS